jgi:hypothetical protein
VGNQEGKDGKWKQQFGGLNYTKFLFKSGFNDKWLIVKKENITLRDYCTRSAGSPSCSGFDRSFVKAEKSMMKSTEHEVLM